MSDFFATKRNENLRKMKLLQNGTPFVGVTRFSVYAPNKAGLNTSARHVGSESAYMQELYAPERLDDRLRIFGQIAAPIYDSFAQRYDYTHLVQYSKELPEAYQGKLFEIAKKYPCVKPVLVQDEDMDVSVRKYLAHWDPSFVGPFVWFRVDDDDVLSVDYLDALGRYATPSNVGMAVSFSTVMVAQYACGRFLNFRQGYLPKNSIGQAYIGWANVHEGVFDVPKQRPHNQIDKYAPLILDPRGIRGLQVRHAWQDTSNIESKVGHRIAHRATELGKLPNVNWKHVEEKFPSLVSFARPNEPEVEVKLRVGEWTDVAKDFSPLRAGTVVEARWRLTFDGRPNDGASLSLLFDNEELAEGHFPRDEARGNYRRLHVNSQSIGGNFFVIPEGARIKSVRLNADGGEKNVKTAQITLATVGELS